MSGPRLLPKRLINAEVATQKKEQIVQGIAIAKKVDSVREALQTEEKNLETFRAQTIKQVQSEIDTKTIELDMLKKEALRIRAQNEEQEQLIQERENMLNKKEEYLNERYTLLENIINESN